MTMTSANRRRSEKSDPGLMTAEMWVRCLSNHLFGVVRVGNRVKNNPLDQVNVEREHHLSC